MWSEKLSILKQNKIIRIHLYPKIILTSKPKLGWIIYDFFPEK